MLISACQQCEVALMAALLRYPEVRRARMWLVDVAELVCRATDAAASLHAASDGGSDRQSDLLTKHNKRDLQKEQ